MQSPAWPVRSRSGTQRDSSDHRCPGRIAMDGTNGLDCFFYVECPCTWQEADGILPDFVTFPAL